MTIFVKMVQKHRLQQGFHQNHARTSYSWSPVPGRAGFSSTHWILRAKPKLWQTCPTWGLFFGVSKTSIAVFVAVGPHCAQQKTCCKIGGWNHHSGHRAIIFCDNCTPRSAIVFLTPGQLAGQMHAPRIHFKEHMNTEKTRLRHQIWPQKRGQFLDLQFAPFPIEGWFWGPLVGPRNGPRNSAFFLLLLPYHLGLNIWPAWPQLQRFSACQTGFTTKGSTCSKCPCTIIIICDQHSYYDCKHTHTQCTAKNMLQNRRLKSP